MSARRGVPVKAAAAVKERAASAPAVLARTEARIDARTARAAAAPPLAAEREQHRLRLLASLRGERLALPPGRLQQLGDRFGLNPLDVDVLVVLWVGAFDPALRAQVVNREPFAGHVGPRGVATLFAHPPRVRLASESPLLCWLMVDEHPLIDGSAALAVDPAVLAWLEGVPELDRALVGRVQLWPPAAPPVRADWPVDALATRLSEGVQQGQAWRLRIEGDDPLAARWLALGVANALGCALLELKPGVGAGVGAGAGAGDGEVAVRLHRQAYLDGCMPCLPAELAAVGHPVGCVPYPVQVLLGQAGGASRLPGVQDLVQVVPPLGVSMRERVWRALWPASSAWPADDLVLLAAQEASASEIAAAAAAAAPADAQAAAQALRQGSRGDLGRLARRLDSDFGWHDLVLPAATTERLREIAFEGRERARVWAEPGAARLFPYGRGLVALFAGAPGTGKTMAAQVIAHDLGLDLLAVDLSAVVTKWVGETAQHLQSLLSSPAARRSVLFFDEADALYAKRVDDVRDAQDRFANQDSGHLMTALESHAGIVLLATNLKANIDGAFLRRIRHVVDFPKPGAAEREHLWRQVLAALLPVAQAQALVPLLPRIARIEATGALIKSAALSGLFMARRQGQPLDLRVIGMALSRELAKEGQALSERDIAQMLEHQP